MPQRLHLRRPGEAQGHGEDKVKAAQGTEGLDFPGKVPFPQGGHIPAQGSGVAHPPAHPAIYLFQADGPTGCQGTVLARLLVEGRQELFHLGQCLRREGEAKVERFFGQIGVQPRLKRLNADTRLRQRPSAQSGPEEAAEEGAPLGAVEVPQPPDRRQTPEPELQEAQGGD